MKRRDLLKKIRDRAKDVGVSWSKIPGRRGPHEAFECDGMRLPIPRGREINEYTAQRIMRDLEDKLGKDWWR